MKKIYFNNIGSGIKKTIRKIFSKPIYLVAFLFLVDFLIVFALCWQIVLFPPVDSKIQSLLTLNKNALDKFVEDWEKQEQESNAVGGENYPDIFLGFTSSIASSTQN